MGDVRKGPNLPVAGRGWECPGSALNRRYSGGRRTRKIAPNRPFAVAKAGRRPSARAAASGIKPEARSKPDAAPQQQQGERQAGPSRLASSRIVRAGCIRAKCVRSYMGDGDCSAPPVGKFFPGPPSSHMRMFGTGCMLPEGSQIGSCGLSHGADGRKVPQKRAAVAALNLVRWCPTLGRSSRRPRCRGS